MGWVSLCCGVSNDDFVDKRLVRRRSVTLSLWDDDYVEQREDRGVLFDVVVVPRDLSQPAER